MHNSIEELPTESLSSLDRKSLEQIIREDVQVIQSSGNRLGQCLKVIRDKVFYKPDFDTFEDYCEESWGISKRHADRLIAGAGIRIDVENYINKLIESGEVSQHLSSLPVVDSHCDALASVAKELRGEVWLKANGELKPNEKLTAKKILDVALKCTTEKSPKNSSLPPLTQSKPATQPKPAVQTTVEDDEQPDDFETYGGDEGDSSQITEAAPPADPIESAPAPEQPTTPPQRKYLSTPKGLIGKVADLKTPERLFDFAIFKLKNLEGMASRSMSEISRITREGARIVFFADDYMKSSNVIQACETWMLELEQVLVRATGEESTSLFDQNHELIFVLRKEGGEADRPKNAPKIVHNHLKAWPGTLLTGDVAFCTGILMRAYTTPGDKVLCPAGGTPFIDGSLSCGNETHYLCKDQEALAYYRGEFGND